MQVYRVSEGNRVRWFYDEGDARSFARDRFDDADGPIPFCQPVDALEMLMHLNELELGREAFMESYGKDLSSPSK